MSIPAPHWDKLVRQEVRCPVFRGLDLSTKGDLSRTGRTSSHCGVTVDRDSTPAFHCNFQSLFSRMYLCFRYESFALGAEKQASASPRRSNSFTASRPVYLTSSSWVTYGSDDRERRRELSLFWSADRAPRGLTSPVCKVHSQSAGRADRNAGAFSLTDLVDSAVEHGAFRVTGRATSATSLQITDKQKNRCNLSSSKVKRKH